MALQLLVLCLCGSTSFAAKSKWPEQYNAGVAAYRSNDFAQAATTFEQATASPDRALQQRAFYNLGNAQYRLGEMFWERAVKSYESALALDPGDEDAKFNLEFVKKKLEELERQKQQQQQQKQLDQDKQKQQQEQPQPQDQPQQKENAREDAQPQSEPQPQEQASRQVQPGDLDKQQAAALLDNLREDERNWNFFPEVQMQDLKETGEPEKDW